MNKISVMISSVNGGLEAERDAVKECFKNVPFVELIGSHPFLNTAHSSSSAYSTVEMARTCDVYFLILSEKYGFEIIGDKSATEAEYDSAIKDDPTKIMVFMKECRPDEIEVKQQTFIKKVSDYYSGYFRPSFKFSHQLQDMIMDSFVNWLIGRAQLGYRLNYLDHFVRLAKQIRPLDIINVYYRVTKDYVELEYEFPHSSQVVQYDVISISRDFWGCINDLQIRCNQWI